MEIKVMKNILHLNNEIAEGNREYLKNAGVVAINILASPGAGKTSLILELIKHISNPVSVVEGDIAGSIDARKMDEAGIPVVQINTSGGCHLDANMFKEALNILSPKKSGLIFIENVGNLVCPASFDLGETKRIVVSSVAEGHDKPIKYPAAFQTSDIIILNKIDMLKYSEFDMDYFEKSVAVYGKPLYKVSCKTGEGIMELAELLENSLHP